MEEQAFQLLLLDKVRKLERQLQEQKPIVEWAQYCIPKLWFEECNGQDSLVIGNQAGEIWSIIAKDAYCDKTRKRWVAMKRVLELRVSEKSINVWSPAFCTSTKDRGQARLYLYDHRGARYPQECKAQVDAMLFEAAKRFGWEIKHV